MLLFMGSKSQVACGILISSYPLVKIQPKRKLFSNSRRYSFSCHATNINGGRTIWHRTIWNPDNLAPGQFRTGQFGTRTICHQTFHMIELNLKTHFWQHFGQKFSFGVIVCPFGIKKLLPNVFCQKKQNINNVK